jgi:hypothetical protein
MKQFFCATCLLAFCYSAFVACKRNEGKTVDIQHLVKLYQEGSGSDDVAGAELQAMGSGARDELIRMLDSPQTPQDDLGTIVQMLSVYFPSEESIRALDRFGARCGDARLRAVLQQMQAMMRKNDPRTIK